MTDSVLPVDAAPKAIHRYCPHCGGDIDHDRTIMWGGWSFDEERHQFTPGTPGSGINFTKTEAAVVGAIIRGLGKTVKKEGTLYSALCRNRPDSDWPEMKMVDVIVCKIRKKMSQKNLQLFETVWAVGFAAVEYISDPVFNYQKIKGGKVTAITKEAGAAGPSHPLAITCSCGHVKSHHRCSGYPRTGFQCRVVGCGCTQFEHRKKK